MDPDEIGLVLARVSQLREKFTDAIRRLSSRDSAHGGEAQSRTFRNNYDSDSGASPSRDEDGSTEIRGLTVMCEALELVEDKLRSLQSLQQQQREESSAVRFELEKSRRTLLERLKEHRGNEWQVVHEALTFVGEKADENDELPLPPYLDALAADIDEHSLREDTVAGRRHDGNVKNLSLGTMLKEERDATNGTSGKNRSIGHGGNLGNLAGLVKTLFSHAYRVTTKAAVVLLSLAAAAAVFESKQRRQQNANSKAMSFADGDAQSLAISGPPLLTVRQVVQSEWCPMGTSFVLEDGYAKCVASEPRGGFLDSQEFSVPDVLNGRG